MQITSRTFVGMFLTASLFLAGCGGGGGSTPTTGNAGNAGGIPTAPSTALGKATLSWAAPLENTDGSVLTNLSGYKIYYGMNQNDLDSVQSISNASVTIFTIENLTAGTWFFAVSAVTNQGVESSISNVASKTI